MKNLIKICAKKQVIYFALNYNLQSCEDKHMSVGKNTTCQICGKPITDNYSRVVGFLTNTKNWIKERRKNDYPNRVFYKA
jgi:anaerobic ribonucleoside-triphosphate reductase